MEDYHWNTEDEPTRPLATEMTGLRSRSDSRRSSAENVTCCMPRGAETSKIHMSNSQLLELLKMPVLPELEHKMDEFWLEYEPKEFHSPSNFQLRASSSLMRQRQEQDQRETKEEEKIRLVLGPSPQHVQVPEWVYHARGIPKLFNSILDFYFKKMHWPDFRELPYWFRRKCLAKKVGADSFQMSSGFAPVWLFLLKELCDADTVEKEWITMCLDQFFENGKFPNMNELPVELEELCKKMQVEENHFYEVVKF